jgi:hypothetical protein
MGKIILVEGAPGTGKSRATKNLDPSTTFIIKPNNKDLPFPGSRKLWNAESGNLVVTKHLDEVGAYLKKINEGIKFKTVIVEDLTHYFSNRVMKEAKIKGYDKWTNLAYDTFMNLLGIEDSLREDLYVIIIGHVETSTDTEGNKTVELQTPGRLLSNVVKIPSYVTYVMHTEVREKTDGSIEYLFLTNRDGSGKEAKSPEGCLDLYMPNDYKLIIDSIEKYHNGGE